MSPVIRDVAEALGVPAALLREPRPGELDADVEPRALLEMADRLAGGLGARLASLFATDERAWNSVYALHQIWLLPRHRTFLRVSTRVDPAHPRFPSIAAKHPSANWFEREVMDMFGLVPDGHPNPTRVSLHDDWPEGEWALRKDFADDRNVPRVEGAFHPFRPVTGEGVFQVPVGPVHAGIIEPGHFRFGVAGEPVLYLQLRLFYVHKGIEKRFERTPWRHGIFLAESVSGDTAVGHALAFAHALERLIGCEVPPRARRLRVVLLELERLDNHLADVGAIATDVAFSVPAAHAQLLRERLVALQERLFGSRLLRGTVAVGGVKTDISNAGREELLAHLGRLKSDFESLVTLLIDSGSFTDRVDGTGTLTTEAARDLGVTGVAARASGLDEDLRRDHPHDDYDSLRFEVPVEEGGDVRARLMVRAREVEQSIGILAQALGALPESPLRAPLPAELPAFSAALGWAEGWRGPCLHWAETGADGTLTRVKVTDPSFRNWPALARAVPGNIIADFPVINKSFNLSYSGNDR
jgi:Ni,Fe-hydrogenase III large subunit/Ni,Fe-hydrogenase III component G